MNILDLFPDRVSPEPNSGCWLWTGALLDGRYGGVYVNAVRLYTHRYSWQLANGRSPSGYVLHSCDIPICVNPDHLIDGDQWDNMADMMKKGRSRSQLSPAQVLEIRGLRGTMTQNAIAARYEIGQSTVSQILRGARWAHL